LAIAQGLHLGAAKDDAGLECVEHLIVEPGAAIIRDQPVLQQSFFGLCSHDQFVSPACTSAASIAMRAASEAGTSGSRNSSPNSPRRDAAYFAPWGLGSINRALWSGASLSWMVKAVAKSPA